MQWTFLKRVPFLVDIKRKYKNYWTKFWDLSLLSKLSKLTLFEKFVELVDSNGKSAHTVHLKWKVEVDFSLEK